MEQGPNRLRAVMIPEGHELLGALKQNGHAVILASSAEQVDAERYIELLQASELVDAYTTSADVKASKPEPDIVNAAIERQAAGQPS